MQHATLSDVVAAMRLPNPESFDRYDWISPVSTKLSFTCELPYQ